LFASSTKVWDRADEFVPERFDLEGPIPNESNTDFRSEYNLVICCFYPVTSYFRLSSDWFYVIWQIWLNCTTPLLRLFPRFVPFSGGPRKCVGDQFALLEAIVALAIVLQKMDIQLVPDQKINMTTGATIHTTNVRNMLCIFLSQYPHFVHNLVDIICS
jgi:carotene epsilon-monooxygenase